MEAYNNTSNTDDYNWTIPNILQLIGIVFVFLLNLHQSLQFQHLQSECCMNGSKGFCSLVVDGFQSKTGKEQNQHSDTPLPI